MHLTGKNQIKTTTAKYIFWEEQMRDRKEGRREGDACRF